MNKIFASALALTAAFLTATTTLAKDISVGEGDNKPVMLDGDKYAVSFIGGEVISTDIQWVSVCRQSRPDAVPCLLGLIPETTVRIKFVLNGCFDKMGPVSFQTIRDASGNEISSISVAAVQIQSKASILTLCVTMPIAFTDIKVRGEQIELEDAKKLIHFVGSEKTNLMK